MNYKIIDVEGLPGNTCKLVGCGKASRGNRITSGRKAKRGIHVFCKKHQGLRKKITKDRINELKMQTVKFVEIEN